MLEYLTLHNLYLLSAVGGGALFVVRTAISFIGGDVNGELDAGGDFSGADADLGDDPFDAGSDVSFKILSLQGLSAFFLIFGLVGLGMLHQSPFPAVASVPAALAAGMAAVYVIAKIFAMVVGLQSSGTMNLQNAVGAQGRIYLRIPPGGATGQVEVAVQGHLKIFDAQSETRTEIPTGEPVQVVRAIGDNLLIVKRV